MDRLRKASPSILVIGDLMIDHYLWGACERISPEAPVQVVEVEKEESLLGGAGNVLNNLLALGAQVGICSVIGEDENGAFLRKRLREKGIDTGGIVVETKRPTTKKSRVIALHQQIVRVDRESRSEIAPESQRHILEFLREQISRYDAILLSDYAKGVLTPALCRETIALARSAKVPVLVDPKGKRYDKYRGATLITPNKKEASEATGIDLSDDEALRRAGEWLRKELDLEYAVITLSEEGMAIFSKTMHKIPTRAREVYDVTGAGDTVLAALGFALSQGMDILDAARFANSAAAVVVAKVGSAVATLDEIARYEHSLRLGAAGEKIKSIEEVETILSHRTRKVVFTNGCFDILHAGHVRYLQEARSFGDLLIVGLNSDTSVKRLKGEGRPINPQMDRATVLSALEAVDFVVLFDEDTPYELIRRIRPDVLVKGGDYAGKEVVGSDIAKETRLVQFVEGKSTTSIIERAKRS